MVIPGHLRKTTLRDRKNMREKIARTAEHKRRAILNNNFNPGRNPIIIGMIIMMLAVLGGLLLGRANMMSKFNGPTSRELRATDELRALRIAVERFRLDCDRYPTQEEGLVALVINKGITNWGGHYVNIIKSDPWHTPYVYSSTSNSVTLFSCGRDKISKTADDLMPDIPTKEEIEIKHEDK